MWSFQVPTGVAATRLAFGVTAKCGRNMPVNCNSGVRWRGRAPDTSCEYTRIPPACGCPAKVSTFPSADHQPGKSYWPMGPRCSWRGWPAPVGIKDCELDIKSLTAAQFASGESAIAAPLPRRTAGEPSVGRRYVTKASVAAPPASVNNSWRPSRDRLLPEVTDQSSQEYGCSVLSPGKKPTSC